MDPKPRDLLKQCSAVLDLILNRMVNLSLGFFTPFLKHVSLERALKISPGFEFDFCKQNQGGYYQPTTNTPFEL